jgi:endonuclease/exonuclease/phosphatase family metal-dependent hydrolase
MCLSLFSGCTFAAGAAPSAQVTNVNSDSLKGPRISVITYNMLHGFGNCLNDVTLDERLALLCRAVENDPPGILILQEASVTCRHGNVVDRLRIMLNGRLATAGISYNSAQLMANGSVLIGFFEGSGILSRYKILSVEGLVYAAQALLPPERRVALRARLSSVVGEVAVIGTHLTNTEARIAGQLTRALQAQELVRWIEADSGGTNEMLSILGGDFNDSPGSSTIRQILATGARDAWSEAASAARGAGEGRTGLNGNVRDPGDIAEERIDFLFVFGANVTVESASLFLDAVSLDSSGLPLWASDHIGVRAELALR